MYSCSQASCSVFYIASDNFCVRPENAASIKILLACPNKKENVAIQKYLRETK